MARVGTEAVLVRRPGPDRKLRRGYILERPFIRLHKVSCLSRGLRAALSCPLTRRTRGVNKQGGNHTGPPSVTAMVVRQEPTAWFGFTAQGTPQASLRHEPFGRGVSPTRPHNGSRDDICCKGANTSSDTRLRAKGLLPGGAFLYSSLEIDRADRSNACTAPLQ
ncbi:hypothetical protein MAPG_09172 [Magnaporthiopsis poae ATCC 64411]|uniref:Uncharacterized protein n=1 Tax=Magnaporthiopsis poae (strain ATCC 64411 / 73-15) TaxID=644358 RepID=A0A0C4E993_MAGP6|nr:hypothetical protein MAPG_09172 [Magnaporthiopsis poae ATCC 64411]